MSVDGGAGAGANGCFHTHPNGSFDVQTLACNSNLKHAHCGGVHTRASFPIKAGFFSPAGSVLRCAGALNTA